MLPQEWSRPFVEWVVVPAHAQASPGARPPEVFVTAGSFNFTVPAGVTETQVEALGASGGDHPNGGTSGEGGRAPGTLAVTTGEVLVINVGGAGRSRWVTTNGGNVGDGRVVLTF